MSKLIFLILFIISSLFVKAQGLPQPIDNELPEHPIPVDKIHESDSLKLNLTKEQQEKIKIIREKKKEAIQKRRAENQEFHKNLAKKTDEEIKAILTDEQKIKFDKLKESRKNRKNRFRKGDNKFGKRRPQRQSIDSAIKRN